VLEWHSAIVPSRQVAALSGPLRSRLPDNSSPAHAASLPANRFWLTRQRSQRCCRVADILLSKPPIERRGTGRDCGHKPLPAVDSQTHWSRSSNDPFETEIPTPALALCPMPGWALLCFPSPTVILLPCGGSPFEWRVLWRDLRGRYSPC